MYNEKGQWIESEDSTKNLLLKIGIVVDTTRKQGTAYMLVKDGVDIGYHSATNAHKKYIEKVV